MFAFLVSACVIFAENPVKNYVEDVKQTTNSELLQGYYLATAGNNTVRKEFYGASTLTIPINTRILELYITNPVYSSWSWNVSPSGLFQGFFPGQWGGMLMSSTGMDGASISITGNIVGIGTRTKTLVLREVDY